MKITKTYRCIQSLDVYERNAFKKFLLSPYFNKNNALIELSEIYDSLSKEEVEQIQKETIWTMLYNDKAFNDTKFRKLNSDLLKLFEQYIRIEAFENDQKTKLTIELKAVNERNLDLLYNTTKAKLDRYEKYNIDKSADHYYYLYETEKTKFELKTDIERKSKKADFAKDFNIADISLNLDIFYLSEKLKYISTTLSWSKLYKIEIEPFDISPIKKIISERKEIIPPIALYYQIYLTLVEPEELRHFLILRKLIKKYLDVFPPKEQRYILDSAVSYGVGKVNSGSLELQKPTLELYKEALGFEGFYDSGFLSPTSFRNIVFFALRTKEFEWAQAFVESYGERLKEEHRENAVTFNLARIAFYKKDFNKVIELLQIVEYNDIFYNLVSRTFLLASYYELDEFDSLEAAINSANIYLRRNKGISESQKKLYLNQNKYLKKIATINQNDKSAIKKLKDQLTETKGVASKPWLIEKINELL